MIKCQMEHSKYKCSFTDGTYIDFADAAQDKSGGEAGFRPHALMEAALATCINIEIRICAEKNNIPLKNVSTQVSLHRDSSKETTFEYSVELQGLLNEGHKKKLLEAAANCSVHNTLSKEMKFIDKSGET